MLPSADWGSVDVPGEARGFYIVVYRMSCDTEK